MNNKTQDNDNKKESRYLADSQKYVQTNMPKVAKYTVWFLVIIIVSMLIIASISKITISTSAEGRVVSVANLHVIQHLEGGIIKQFYVKEGEKVSKGQVLLVLDETLPKATYQRELTRMVLLRANIARLKAVVNRSNTINFPSDLIIKHPDIVKLEQKVFDAKRKSLKEKIAVWQKEYELTKKELEMITPLVKENILSVTEKIRLEKELNRLQGNIQSEINKYIANAQTDLNKAKAELVELQKAIKASRDKYQRTVIRSPIKGIVNSIYISTVGQVINSGQKIMDIAPLNSKLIIEAKVVPADIGFIHIGQKATVRISAYEFSTHGGLNARVTHISSDTIIDSEGESYYEIKLETDRDYLGTRDDPLPIKTGMTVTVNLQSGEQTILQYVLKPFLKIKEEAAGGR